VSGFEQALLGETHGYRQEPGFAMAPAALKNN